MFFPRYYVVISDRQLRLVDYRLYENEQDALRAVGSWRIENGRLYLLAVSIVADPKRSRAPMLVPLVSFC